MNKKVLVMAVALMAVAMLATPLVGAVPWTYPRNNDKFQTYGVTGTCKFSVWMNGEHEFIPSKDKVNMLIISGDETFITYDITVGSNIYHLGTDFAYTGHFEYIFYDVTAWNPNLPPYTWPSEYRAEHMIVDYVFDFSAFSDGIEGTLRLRAESNQGGLFINSLAGTGDLQNVQIKATILPATPLGKGIYQIGHAGIVSGWPE